MKWHDWFMFCVIQNRSMLFAIAFEMRQFRIAQQLSISQRSSTMHFWFAQLLCCCFWLEKSDLNIIYNEIRSRNMRKSTVKPLKRMQFVMHYDWINAFNLIILWWFWFCFFQLFRFISANLFILLTPKNLNKNTRTTS